MALFFNSSLNNLHSKRSASFKGGEKSYSVMHKTDLYIYTAGAGAVGGILAANTFKTKGFFSALAIGAVGTVCAKLIIDGIRWLLGIKNH